MEERRVRKRGVRDNREEVERGRMRHGREMSKEEREVGGSPTLVPHQILKLSQQTEQIIFYR